MKSATLTRRALLGTLAAGAAGYAALGPRGFRDPRAQGRTTITYWEKWTGHEALAMQRVVDDFNESQSRIFVRLISMTMIEQRAMLAIAGGAPPDIIGLYAKLLPLYARSGAILPLDGRMADAGIGASWYAGAIWRQCTVSRAQGGTVFGLPVTCSTMALYMSTRALREVGLDAGGSPRTIAELDEWSRLLTRQRTDGTYERLGFVQSEPGWWPYCWGNHFGGMLFDEEQGRATCASEANVRAYEWMQQTARTLGVQRMMNFQSGLGSYSSAQQPLLAGRVAMCLHGPFLVNVLRQYAPDFEFAVAPFPTESADVASPTGLVEADVLTIPRGSRHPDEAFEFIAFTQRSDVQERLCIAHAKPTPLVIASESYRREHPNPLIGVHEAIAASPKGFGTPATRAWPEYEALLRRAIESEIWQCAREPRDSLLDVQRGAQEAIDRAARIESRRRDG